MDEESLFAAALAQPPGTARRVFLDGACGSDLTIRDRIDRLLAAHDRSWNLLDQKPVSSGSGPGTSLGRAGALIGGRYELVQEVGEGGMGSVWLAEQTQPIRRRVAVKLIRAGMDTRTVLARFEAERQALALMDHPHIARVFDGGTTEDGRPYFVMEYVEGVTLTEFCDQARLGIAERLDLFMTVCQAVQHAHLKGIIHRDLKPSNILVGLQDGRPVPKVIDFGLAKATGRLLSDATIQTAPGSMLGTPLYMSPEQTVPANPDIDARADVYALGAILYELLTGTTPLEHHRCRAVAWDEVFRLIREEDPPRPSNRLTVSDALPSLAALRHLEPNRLTRLVRGDLDWIVMKCLEKDRSRRYETPSSLARDIQRYQDNESVEACPPTARYRLGKFLRRHRVSAVVAAIILILLVGGITGTTWGLIRADQARLAEAKRAEGEKAANAQAQKRLLQIKNGTEILASVFDDLDPKQEEKEGKPLRAILGDRLVLAAQQLAGEGVGDPLLVASLQDRLGRSLIHLGLASKAILILEQARATQETRLGGSDPETLATTDHLGRAYKAAGKPDLALPLLKRTLGIQQTRLGASHISTLETMNTLAGTYLAVGEPMLAVPLYEEGLRLTRISLGPEHSDTLILTNNLATAHQVAGKPEFALPLLEEVVERLKITNGPVHPDTLAVMNNLAAADRAAGKTDQAVALYQEVLQGMMTQLGPVHPDTLVTMNNLAAGYRAVGKLELAVPLLRDAANALEAHHFEVQHAAQILQNLIATLEHLSQFQEAETWRRKWLVVVQQRVGTDTLAAADELQALGSNLAHQEKWSEGESLLRESLAIRELKEPAGWPTQSNRSLLGSLLMKQKKFAEAEPLLIQGYEGLRARIGEIPQSQGTLVRDAGSQIVKLYDAWDRPEMARVWSQKFLEMDKPAEHP